MTDIAAIDDPIECGGYFRAPSGVDHRHVWTIAGTWRPILEVTDINHIKNIGGCAMLGSGQLVPLALLVSHKGIDSGAAQ